MSSTFEISNSEVFILRPYSEFEIRFKLDAAKGEQLNIYYKLINCRGFNADGSNDIVFSGSAVISSSSMPSITLRSPEVPGDYRLWVSLASDFADARAARVIVTVTKVEVSPEISLFKDESELISGVFFLYEKITVKKLLYNKSSEYKLFFCQAQPSSSVSAGISHHIIKVGFRHFLKSELIGLNKLAARGAEGFSEAADFIFREDFGIILFKFNGSALKNECINLIDFIESKNKIEIITAIKNFLIENLTSNFYGEPSPKKDVLINDYESLFFGGKVFGLFSYPPHVKIEGGGLVKPMKIEGENRSTLFETHKFKGTVEKAYDRSIVALARSGGNVLERSYFIYNPVIKKERLAKLINSTEYDFEIKSAPPLAIEEFYNVLLNKTFSENKDLAGLIKKNDIINFLRAVKSDKYSYQSAFSVGGLNPREMYLSGGDQILVTSFEDVETDRHILYDFALFETYLKVNGAYNLMIKNSLPAKAADEFEDALDGAQVVQRPCFAPYLAAIETIRECATEFFSKPGEAGEYYTALFLTEIGLLKNFYINAQSKIAQFIFRAADKRAKAILSGSIRTCKLFGGNFAAPSRPEPPQPQPKTAEEKSVDGLTDESKTAEGSKNTEPPACPIKSTFRKAAQNFVTLDNYDLVLVCLSPPYAGKEFKIDRGATTIGRSRQSDICLRESPFISGQHATIEVSEIAVKIKDLSSTNGTFINGDKTDEKVVHEECEVQFGDISFKLEFRKKGRKK
jgi:hypothetical protein